MFNWYKKEAPVFTGIARGVGGFGFGKSAAAATTTATPAFMVFSVPAPVEAGKVTAGGYTWYTFTSSGAFTVTTVAGPQAGTDGVPGNYISVMMVGGGGSGGSHHGAGGGGGGVVYATNPNGYGVIDLLPGGNSNPIPIRVGSGGFSMTSGNSTCPGVPGQATKFGSGPEPYHLIAFGGGGGGSHQQPNYYGSGANPTPYGPMGPGGWVKGETGPTSIEPFTNSWWNPNVPGGSNSGGAGPRSGGCGGGDTWPSPLPNPYGTNYAADASVPGSPTFVSGGPGYANQPIAPSNSATYGYGNAGGAGNSDLSGGGGGTSTAGSTGPGGNARSTPANFWAGSGANHPVYPNPYAFGAGGGGAHNTDGATYPGGTANPGSGGPGQRTGGSNATGYGNGGGGCRVFNTTSGAGSNGIMIIKVKTS